jgi:hypothetical protein
LPDVALLEVAAAGPGCVLGSWPSAEPGAHPYLGFGFVGGTLNGDPLLQRVPLRFGRADGDAWTVTPDDPKQPIVEGMAGGAVLDTTTGTVVAIIKAGPPHDDGHVVPLPYALRRLAAQDPAAEVWSRHDRHHANGVWPRAADVWRAEQPEDEPSLRTDGVPVLGAVDLAVLFGELADDGLAGDQVTHTLCLAADVPPSIVADEVGSAREAVLWLLRQNGGEVAAQQLVDFLGWLPRGRTSSGATASDPARARIIDKLVQRFGLRIPTRGVPPQPGRHHPGAHVLIEPAGSEPPTYKLSVWSVWRHGLIELEECIPGAVEKGGIAQALTPVLRGILDKVRITVGADKPLLVDFVVPSDLRDLEPGAWLFHRGDPLDSRDVVVLRDWDRFRHDTIERMKQRLWWDNVAAQALLPLTPIPCGELWTSGACPPFLPESVVVVPSSMTALNPGSAVVNKLLNGGGSVAVWWSRDCREHVERPDAALGAMTAAGAAPGSACSGDGFGSGVISLLNGVTLADFPVQFWLARQSSGRGAATLGRVGVMWDHPDRRPGWAPLSDRGGV